MWTFKYDDDHVLSFDDLTPSTFQKIATKYDLFWLALWEAPGANVDALYDLIVARAELAGIPAPPASSMRDVRTLIERLENVDEDDRPKAGMETESLSDVPDVPETTSSSGSPESTTGRRK